MKRVEMIVATTDVIPKYGGQWRLSEQALQSLAEQFRTLDRPMRIEHDARHTMATRVIDAKVRQRPDGEWELRAIVEADEHEWAKAGDRTGISVPIWTRIARTPHDPNLPDIRLAVEPNALGEGFEGTLDEAIRPLRGQANVSVHALFQFNVDADTVKIIFEAAEFVFLAIASGAIYDVAKAFWPFGKSRTNHIEFVIDRTRTPDSQRDTVKLIVETDDLDVLRDALGTARDAVTAFNGTVDYNPVSHAWEQIGSDVGTSTDVLGDSPLSIPAPEPDATGYDDHKSR